MRTIGSIADITERRRAEDALRELTRTLEQRVQERTAQLEESNAALEAFGYSVSHDLRAPLRTMQGFAKALLEDYADCLNQEGRGYAARIATSDGRMDQLIQDLLAYSRLSRTELEPNVVDLDGIVSEVKEQLRAALQESRATLSVKRPLGRVHGHRATLVQIVLNLVSNALKFVRAGTARLSRSPPNDGPAVFGYR